MSKYYRNIINMTEIDRKIGNCIDINPFFKTLSCNIIVQCTFLQKTLQQIVYDSYGSEVFSARKSLKDNPNPKSRVEFLCSFPYPQNDSVVSKVFEFAKESFKNIYEVRNILAHEVWSLSESFPSEVLFSSLDEESRLLLISGRLCHKDDTTSRDVYDATVRFINSLKVISLDDLESAIKDTNTCNWSLMHINNIINEKDNDKKEAAKEAFFLYKGTSHLFPENHTLKEKIAFSSSKEKNIDK